MEMDYGEIMGWQAVDFDAPLLDGLGSIQRVFLRFTARVWVASSIPI